jgi:hypothetical protein
MVFGLSSSEPQPIHQRSSAIGEEFSTKLASRKPGNPKSGEQERGKSLRRKRFGVR